MLPAAFRLPSPRFSSVFTSGRSGACGELSLRWRPNNTHLSQVGVIATKKNFPKAHDRNRAKRLLREALRPELFRLRPGFDMIVLYRYRPEQLDFARVRSAVETLLRNARLI